MMSEKMSISLEKKHIEIVEAYAEEIGVRAFSTALQALITQFTRMRDTGTSEKSAPKPGNGTPRSETT